MKHPQRPTLSLPARDRTSTPFKTPERIQQDFAKRRQNGRPNKPKAWSHQDDLKALVGQIIKIQLPGGATMLGKLENADAYTLKLSFPDKDQSTLIYFKSALLAFGPADPRELTR